MNHTVEENKDFGCNFRKGSLDLLPTVQLRDGGRQLVQLTPVLPEPRRVVRHDGLVHSLLPRLYRRLRKRELQFKFRALVTSVFLSIST